MARQRLECSSCQAKFSGKTFCPRCGQPTQLANAQERILWEMGQWEDSRLRVVPQKPARIVLTPSSPQVLERMARPNAGQARQTTAPRPAVNGASGISAPIEQLDLTRSRNGNGSSVRPPQPQPRPQPQTRPQAAPQPQPQPRPQPTAPRPQPQPKPPVPQARTTAPPVRPVSELPAQPPVPRPPMPQPRPPQEPRAGRPPYPGRPPIPRTPVKPPAARPAEPEPVAAEQAEPEAVEPEAVEHEAVEEVATMDSAPLEQVLREVRADGQVVRTRPRPEIPFAPLPTSVGAATELREAVDAPSTARRRLSRKEKRAKAKQAKETARHNAEQAKASAKAEEQARKDAAKAQKDAAKAAKKAGGRRARKQDPKAAEQPTPVAPPAQVEPTPAPLPVPVAEDEAERRLSRRERRVEKLLDALGAVEDESPTLVVEGRSRMRSATLIVTRYRVALLARGARRRMIGWIPLEEIERIKRVWRGAPTAHIEGSFERLSFQAGTTEKLEQAIALIREEVREARAPGARRHHAEIIQLWCERTGEIWESDAGRLRLWIRRHPIFTIAWLGSLIPLAYFGAQRL